MNRLHGLVVNGTAILFALSLTSCMGYRTELDHSGGDARMHDARVDAARDRSADMGMDAAADGVRDSSTDPRTDLGSGDARAVLARGSARDVADVARDLPQDQPRELPIRDVGADSRGDVQRVDLAVRETAGDSPIDAKPDSMNRQDSTRASSLCVSNMTVCAGDTVNTSISSLHCGGCDSPCDPGNVCSEGICQPVSSDWLTLQQARDGDTGALLWTFPGDTALSFPAVLASGYVYVASTKNVYAVDIATHAPVWTDSVGGWLSLAAHKLFVASADGTLSAYQLSSQ